MNKITLEWAVKFREIFNDNLQKMGGDINNLSNMDCYIICKKMIIEFNNYIKDCEKKINKLYTKKEINKRTKEEIESIRKRK